MKVFDTPDIRNVALIGHGDSGKTSLASALLFTSGAVNRMGSVDDGTSVTDFDEEEIERKFSIQTAVACLEWKGTKVNLVDTPGYAAFLAEAKAGLAVADSAILLVDGVAGVEIMTNRTFSYAEEYDLPVVFAMAKLDRERASFNRSLQSIQDAFGRTAVPVQLPIGKEHEFSGIVDLLTMKAYAYAGDEPKPAEVPIPDDLKEEAEAARSALTEMIAESDEALMEAFFENGGLNDEQMISGLRNSVRDRKILPVTCTAATHMVGAHNLLNLIVDVLPSPAARGEISGTNPANDEELTRKVSSDEPTSLFVFKTVADPFSGRLSLFRVCSGVVKGDSNVVNMRTEQNERLGHVLTMLGKQYDAITELRAGDIGVVAKLKDSATSDTLADPSAKISYPAIKFPEPSIAYAVQPKSKGDDEKISTALAKLTEEDPVLQVGRDPQTGEMLVRGSSQQHVEIAISKMKKKFGVEAVIQQPKVPYLETIRKKVGPIEGKHKKQSGGRGQFGVCVIEMEPLPRGKGFEFVDKIFGGSIPQNFRPAVEKGIAESAARGVIAGYPVIDFRVTLLDGKHHNVDSSEMAFKVAGSLAFKEGVKQAKPALLEPIMQVEITAPEEYMGDIMGDLSSRRGKPQGMEPQGQYQVIKAEVPMSEMLTYASTLKSITSDQGTYHMEFAHYDPTPTAVQQQIIADAEAAKEQDG
jgi:elongation factor G